MKKMNREILKVEKREERSLYTNEEAERENTTNKETEGSKI